MNNDCGLCNLINKHITGEVELNIVYESEHTLALHATQPFAEVHILILSKKHIPSIFDLTENDNMLIYDIYKAIRIASEEVFALKGAFKVEMYTGKFPTFTAGKHLHCHVIYDSTID